MNRLIQCFFLGLVLVASGASAQSEKDAFKDIKKRELKKQYNHLAIVPLAAPPALKMPDNIKTLIETEVSARLEKEGFKVLPVSVMRDIRNHMRELMGLSATPSESDTKKLVALLDHSYRELLLRHDVDGLVALQVQMVGAPFADDKAEWHGTSQKIKRSGDGLMKFIAGKKYSGTVAASTLRVGILDRTERTLYAWNGGIEVLMERKGKNLEYMAEDTFWQDKKRVEKAVRAALKPL